MFKKVFILIFMSVFLFSPVVYAGIGLSGGGGGGSGDATTIHGLAVEDPDAADDGKYIQYEHTGTLWQLATPAGGGDMSEAVWDGDSDGFIDADAGGTDIDTSAATGTARVDAGTWSINAAISGTTVDASTDFTIGGTVITDATITDDGTLVLAPTTAVSFSDKPITNVGDIAVDSISSDGAAAALTITATAGQVVSVESVTMDGGALNATSIGAGTPGTIVGTTIDASTDFTVGGTVITDATITDDGSLTINPTTLVITADISTTAAQDWDLLDNNASALSFDATGKAGILNIVSTDGSEGISMSGTLAVTGATTLTGALDASTGGGNITFADGQLMDGSGVTHTGATDEGWVLPTWADVSPTTDQAYIAWDATGNALKIYDGGWLSFATAAAPLDAKYIVQQADATLTAEQSLGALGSGILYSTTTTGVLSIASEAQLETTLGVGFGASKAATSGYIFVADGTDFESVAMSGDASIATGGAVTVADDSHAHVVANIDSANSVAWAGQVSDETGTGGMVFGTAPTFTTSIAFNAVTDTVAGIQNQNLLDKTAAETVSGIYTHSANIDLDDGTGASPGLIFTDATNETFTITKADGGNLDIDINNAADRVVDLANAGAGDVNLTIDGDMTIGGILTVTGVADDHYLDLVNNAATPPSAGTNSIYTVNNVIKIAEGGVEKDLVLEADSVTWTGTTHSFAAVTNVVLPTAAADASGEVSMSAGNQFKWHDGTKVVTIDTTPTNDNYVLKYDNASATFTLEADETGGTPAWSSIGASQGAMAVTSGSATETTTFTQSADDTEWLFDFTAAFTAAASPSLFKIIQQTGNAEAVTLVDIQASDSDVIVLAAGDGTNEWQVSQPGRLSNNGTADLNLAAATDLLIGGAQIDHDDMAGTATVTTASDVSVGDDVLLADGAVVGITGNEVITFNAAGTINFSGAAVDVADAFTAGTIAADTTVGGTVITASTSLIGPLVDAAGAEDLDIGSADVTDITFMSDGDYVFTPPADTDITVTFTGTTNSGSVKWMEDENSFIFDNGLQAPMEVTAADADGETIATADLNTVRTSSGAGDWDLPADSCDAATGNWVTVIANAAHVASITSLDTGDQFVLSDGTVLTADDELDTGGSAWDSCTVQCVASGIWLVVGERGTCADGGVAD